jgi:hypothetical protein
VPYSVTGHNGQGKILSFQSRAREFLGKTGIVTSYPRIPLHPGEGCKGVGNAIPEPSALEIQELDPGFITFLFLEGTGEGTPFGLLRTADQVHPCFMGKTVGLPGVATDTGGNHVFPRGLPTTVAGYNVIHVQVLG